ncbi:MAG: hypothetical protein JO223_05760 [Hyphomicrobiales bacterium]|nr:hypothetical protein [Hyphomicrobiales bacterium]
MHHINSHVTYLSPAAGLYRLYYQSRRIGEAVMVDNDAFHVSHLFSPSEGVVASLDHAANWLEKIEHAVAAAALERMA